MRKPPARGGSSFTFPWRTRMIRTFRKADGGLVAPKCQPKIHHPSPQSPTKANPAPRSKVPLPVLRTERDKRTCAHDDDFKILQGEKPENAARRREKWRAKRCPACNDILQQKIRTEAAAVRASPEATAARLVRKETRRRAFAMTAAGGKPKRLPDGSVFSATYDATAVTWTGTLAVPGSGPVSASFPTCGGLLHELAKTWDFSRGKP